ncbi:MAG: sigma E protease regulator RseP [Aeromonas sp.]
MASFLWNTAAFFLALGLLIAVHEFGHFWVARCCGVRVERFSIGFGKTLWSRTGRDGTEYALSLIPLGGYVKMLDDATSPADAPFAFKQKSVWQRFAIVAAGPLANFIFAFFALWLMFLIGVPSVRPVIDRVAPDSIAARAELTAGMEIVAVDGQTTAEWESVTYALIRQLGNETATLTLKTPGYSQTLTKTLDLRAWQFNPDQEAPLTSLGITPLGGKVRTVVAQVVAGSASERAGLRAGDHILAINQQPLTTWQTFVLAVQQAPEQALNLRVSRAGRELTLTLTPASKTIRGRQIGFAGISPTIEPLADKYRILLEYGPLEALGQSAVKTWQLMELNVQLIVKLIKGILSLDNLSGPISIAKGAGASAGYGVVYFLSFLALISVNLGIINLFPLPVLDGGHLVYFLIEGITGKAVPEKIQAMGYRIGTGLIVVLMSIALFNDFARL